MATGYAHTHTLKRNIYLYIQEYTTTLIYHGITIEIAERNSCQPKHVESIHPLSPQYQDTFLYFFSILFFNIFFILFLVSVQIFIERSMTKAFSFLFFIFILILLPHKIPYDYNPTAKKTKKKTKRERERERNSRNKFQIDKLP